MSNTEPAHGAGGTEGGQSSSPENHKVHEDVIDDERPSADNSSVTQIPLGTPMSDDEWRSAKKDAERAQPEE